MANGEVIKEKLNMYRLDFNDDALNGCQLPAVLARLAVKVGQGHIVKPNLTIEQWSKVRRELFELLRMQDDIEYNVMGVWYLPRGSKPYNEEGKINRPVLDMERFHDWNIAVTAEMLSAEMTSTISDEIEAEG